MFEPAVTVVRCRACGRSERLTHTAGRFWCAWCQQWTEIEAEQVQGATIVPDGDHFRLAPAEEPKNWMQPLRVPAGWHIGWNSFAEEDLDPISAHFLGGRNLFLATNEQIRRAIDIEYRTERDQPEVGRYYLRMLPLVPAALEERRRDSGPLGTDWDQPVHTFETTSRPALVAELEACLRGERG